MNRYIIQQLEIQNATPDATQVGNILIVVWRLYLFDRFED